MATAIRATTSARRLLLARPFTTSIPRPARNDASTIDFAFLPASVLAEPTPEPPLRVPLLHTTTNPRRTGPHAVEPESGILLGDVAATLAEAAAAKEPTIHTLAGDGTHLSAPSALSDADAGAEVDFAELARGMGEVVGKVEAKVTAEGGVVRELWEGMVEDLLGPRRKGKSV